MNVIISSNNIEGLHNKLKKLRIKASEYYVHITTISKNNNNNNKINKDNLIKTCEIALNRSKLHFILDKNISNADYLSLKIYKF